MKKSLLFITILAVMIFNFNISWAAPPDIAAPSAILIDGKSGKVLFEKNADEKRLPASTTKIMTAILAIEHGKLDEVVKITKNPAALIEKGSSQISLIEGEEGLTLEQLLYALLLQSANDAAVAIAEHISGIEGEEGVAKFAELMNARAKELGAANTTFQNPNGLDNNYENHLTTARDLAIIARYGMTLPKFREIVSTVKYVIPATNKQPVRNYITNSNKMIWTINKAKAYEFSNGIKTGYTIKSNHCFVGSAKKDDMELISVVLGIDGSKGNIYDDTKTLFEYGFNTFENMKLLEKDQIVTTVKLNNVEEKSINLIADKDLQFLANESDKAGIQSKISTNELINAPIAKGDILGIITFSNGNIEIGKVNLIAAEAVEKPKMNILSLIFRILIFIIILVAIWMAIVALIRYNNRKNRYKFMFKKKRMF